MEGKGRWGARSLSTELGASVFDVQTHTATPLDGRVLYVGFNAGEWGGRIQRVDLTTGAVETIEFGPVDPVTGVIHEPVERRYVLVAISLVRLVLSRGRILRRGEPVIRRKTRRSILVCS